MARKSSKPGKTDTKAKLTLVTEAGVEQEASPVPPEMRPKPALYFVNLFQEQGFQVQPLEDGLYFVLDPERFGIMLTIDEDLPFLTFEFPLIPRKTISRAKILDWINERMSEFPMIRVYFPEAGIIMASYDYLYMPDAIDADHILYSAGFFFQYCLTILDENVKGILDESAIP